MKQDKFVIEVLYIIIVSFFVFMALVTYPNWLPRTDFNSEVWKTGDLTKRNRMWDDFLDRRIISGKSSGQVRDILGPPDHTFKKNDSAWVWIYNVNMGAGASGTGINVYFDLRADSVVGVEAQN